MDISFTGKRALVTGAAQGIGLAIVKKLVSCGAKVVALDVKEEQLKKNLKELPEIELVVVDLRNWNVTLETLKNIGQVQLVVNCAGVNTIKRMNDIEEKDFHHDFDVNVKAVMAICKHVVNDLTSTKTEGAIVNIVSISAFRPTAMAASYSASKAALLQYTRCLALDCAPKGIRVNAVSPGITRTPMAEAALQNPQARAHVEATVPTKEKFCEPEDIANAVAFLLCDKVARKITGVNLNVDSGSMLT